MDDKLNDKRLATDQDILYYFNDHTICMQSPLCISNFIGYVLVRWPGMIQAFDGKTSLA